MSRPRAPPRVPLAPPPHTDLLLADGMRPSRDLSGIAGRITFEEATVTTVDHTTERREQLLARLANAAEDLASSAGWQRWLRLASRFRTYSVGNQLLILAQDPEATLVAGYRAWNGWGRHVRKGERGIGILAPIPRRKADEETNEAPRGLRGVRIVYVFDVRQTDGDELPYQGLPEVRVPDEGLGDDLAAKARAAGLTIVATSRDGSGTRGWYEWETRTITLVDDYPLSSQVRTLLHELAHACDPVVPRPDAVRAERELVAESAAYLVGTALGIDLDEASAHYVTSWGGDQAVLKALADQSLHVAAAVEGMLHHGA